MEASGLIKVAMVIFLIAGNGHNDRVLVEEATMRECKAAQQAAVDFNSRFRWFWEKDDREIVVWCRAHPGDREA